MNYYEELGVRQDAPTEDIRRAYKRLARLLHPDAQTEPDLKTRDSIGVCLPLTE